MKKPIVLSSKVIQARLKGMPGWDVCQYPDGTIEWRTPSGHTYTVEPPPLITPAPPSAPVEDDTPAPF